MTRLVPLSFAALVFLFGCAVGPQPAPRPIYPEPDPIAERLIRAGKALAANRLTTPANDNAYDIYQQILRIEPGNQAARNGINIIVETYLAWALDHVDRSVAEPAALNRARHYVSKAEAIDSRHPNIAPVVARINDSEEASNVRYQIDAQALKTRNANAIEFERMAGEIIRRQSFVTINAPDDASGRWLYQQLNARVSFRIEASFAASSRPFIVLTH